MQFSSEFSFGPKRIIGDVDYSNLESTGLLLEGVNPNQSLALGWTTFVQPPGIPFPAGDQVIFGPWEPDVLG